jgi:hypothetical protein
MYTHSARPPGRTRGALLRGVLEQQCLRVAKNDVLVND